MDAQGDRVIFSKKSYTKLVDQEVINLCKENKEIGHKAVYEHSVKYVFAIVSRYVTLEHARKDIVQEVYANTFSNIAQFDSEKGSFKSWIRKIAVNQSLMFLRRKNSFQSLIPITDNVIEKNSVQQDLSGFERENVLKVLSKMPIGYKTVFMMNVIDGYTHEDISEKLSISKETSRSQLSRAKKWLQNRLVKKNKIKLYGSL